MANYTLPPNSKPAREIERAVSEAVAQVTAGSLPEAEKIGIAYLIVREKIDRMESSGAYDEFDVGSKAVCDAVMDDIAQRLGHEVVTLDLQYPDDLGTVAKNGFALVA